MDEMASGKMRRRHTAHVTARGQVTIPADVREKLDLHADTAVCFEETPEGGLLLTKQEQGNPGRQFVERLVAAGADFRLTTGELMSMTRGDDEPDTG